MTSPPDPFRRGTIKNINDHERDGALTSGVTQIQLAVVPRRGPCGITVAVLIMWEP
jgi:hypothetical protein